MKTRTNIKAGGLGLANHNETLLRDVPKVGGLKAKTNVKAGGIGLGNHNETMVRES